MSLNDGGLIIDEIVRSPSVPRSRVDEETEGRLSKLIEVIDFKDPDFRIRIPANPVRLKEPEEARPDNANMFSQEIKPAKTAAKKELLLKPRGKIISESPEISKASGKIENSDINDPKPAVVILESPVIAPDSSLVFELVDESSSASENVSESISKPVSGRTSEIVLELVTEPLMETSSETVSEPSYEPAHKPASEPVSESISKKPASENEADKPSFSQETFKVPEKSPGKKIKSLKQEKGKPEKNIEPKKDLEPEKEIALEKDLEPEKEIGNPEESIQEKPEKVSGTAGKTAKKEAKKGKEKPAVPRQYNLGDYL
jgi:hypothetical protein